MKIQLSQNQIKKLIKGGCCQVGVGSIGSGIDLKLHPMNVKRLQQAQRRNKGARLVMSQEEIDASGLKELLQKGFKAVKKYVGEEVKRRGGTRKVLTDVLEKAIPAAAAAINPKLAPVAKQLADNYADDLVDFVGDRTKAFGAPPRRGRGRPRKQMALPSSSFSHLIGPNAPAMNPPFPKMDDFSPMMIYVPRNAGSFKTA